ncbi:hypothetical protein Rmag_0638 [Candidatus Ruthia magnifica str. Cm (Calyptogena magnifica)]|uniref:Uncharacterized protein n=1 Tax=Ruthia magnifica subsp. Calyptogena magnifica TaxID=413404 RepID=A1AWS6_RUTMC|nr:hypothetical protein Rmag_0638 [Candidatus Ruthia magnifica str. Cm (Calyptogena magnifica)]
MIGLMIIKIAIKKRLEWVNLDSLKIPTQRLDTLDKLETVKKYKVEMVCTNNHLNSVISVIKFTHPYEQVAYFIIKMENQ